MKFVIQFLKITFLTSSYIKASLQNFEVKLLADGEAGNW